jgi:hypothetical protein
MLHYNWKELAAALCAVTPWFKGPVAAPARGAPGVRLQRCCQLQNSMISASNLQRPQYTYGWLAEEGIITWLSCEAESLATSSVNTCLSANSVSRWTALTRRINKSWWDYSSLGQIYVSWFPVVEIPSNYIFLIYSQNFVPSPCLYDY